MLFRSINPGDRSDIALGQNFCGSQVTTLQHMPGMWYNQGPDKYAPSALTLSSVPINTNANPDATVFGISGYANQNFMPNNLYYRSDYWGQDPNWYSLMSLTKSNLYLPHLSSFSSTDYVLSYETSTGRVAYTPQLKVQKDGSNIVTKVNTMRSEEHTSELQSH